MGLSTPLPPTTSAATAPLGVDVARFSPQTLKSVNFHGPELLQALELERGSPPTTAKPCHEFFLHLALCHSIIVDDRNEWSAQSPDELALVGAADYFGFKFVGQHRYCT
jgi:magnesium-transporting ATPase (P-type)